MHRLTLSDDDRRARDLLVSWLEEVGAQVEVDEMGSIFGRRPGRDAALPPVMTGSHLDTQPRGGRFDGVLGVMGALEVLRTLQSTLRRRLVDWTNESRRAAMPPALGGRTGPRLGVGGRKDSASATSWRASATGARSPPRAARSTPTTSSTSSRGRALSARAAPSACRAASSACTGTTSHRGDGQPGRHDAHGRPGRRPGDRRRDGPRGQGPAGEDGRRDGRHRRRAAPASQLAQRDPGAAHFTVDIRAWDDELALRAWELLRAEFRAIAARHGCGSASRRRGACSTTSSRPTRRARARDGRAPRILHAGHGERRRPRRQLPGHRGTAAMVFVPSVGGRSHVEVEETSWEDCEAGANVLLQCVLASAEHRRE